MKCSKCNKTKKLIKGLWCKECKNEYERIRRSKLSKEKKKEMYEKEKERYRKNKENVKKIIINKDEKKTCSVCKVEKYLIEFHIAKCKGNIRAMCKTCSSLKRKEHYKKNKDKIIKQTSDYKVNKMKNNPTFKFEVRLRARIYHAFKSQNLKKRERTLKYIGCTSSELKKWIEYQFYDGMTLENYGKYYHIDHVKPCSSFDLSKEEDIKECFSWKNLRPYLASKNEKKSSKIILKDILLQELKVTFYQKQINM